jgi:hypothetical protein
MDFAQKIYDVLDGNSDKGEDHQYHTIYAATLPQYNTGNNDVYFTSPEYSEFIDKTKQGLLQK